MSTYPFCVLLAGSFLIGSVIGAYFCTARYRITAGRTLLSTGCICPECGHALLLKDQIPVLSWLFLKGRCRYCRACISPRYPLTEAGFMIFYTAAFALFNSTPAVYLSLWYIYVVAMLILNCRKHVRGLMRAVLIMTLFHILIACIYVMLNAAVTYSP